MSVAERISMCRLLELMLEQPEMSRRMGLEDVSYLKDSSAGKSRNSHFCGGRNENGNPVK